MNDLRLALRQLRRSPGFTAVAVLTLALGIGANTAIFSLINALLFRPLPFREPSCLVWIANLTPGGKNLSGGASRRTTLRDWREQNQSFEGLAGYHAFFDQIDSTLTGNGEASRLQSVVVTGNFLEVLGVQPRLGRGFLDEECQSDGPQAVILTDRFWRRQFQADPGAIGQSLTINNRARTVVGILPPSFDFSSIFSPGSKAVDFLRPASQVTETKDTAGNIMAVIGRLKRGVTLREAQAEFDVLNQQLRLVHPESSADYGARLTSLREWISGRFHRPFLVLSCAVGGVLLIACVNLSNLLLARARARRKEFAVRMALGAGRARLIRQMLTESLMLSGCGAALGLALAYFATDAVARSHAFTLPRLETVGVDGMALGFTLLISVGVGFLFGIVPALQLSNGDVQGDLREASHRSSQGKRAIRIREALVVSEVALACVLLVGAGLLMRSFVRLIEVDLGFQPEQVAAWRIVTGGPVTTKTQTTAYYRELVRRIEALPGVESAGLTGNLPLGVSESLNVRAKGENYRAGEIPVAFVHQVNEGYFKTMRIPLRAGRCFDAHDTAESREEFIVVVNEMMARSLWPGRDPIGQVVLIDDDPGAEWKVIGVVGNVRQNVLEKEAGPEMYMTGRRWTQELVVRTKGTVASIVPAVRATLRELSSNTAVDDFQSLGQVVDRAVSPKRLTTVLLGFFSILALLLASVGIYGVIAYSVSQRTHEIGIRLALGSPRPRVLRLIIAEGMRPAFVGCAVGLLASLALTRMMQALLFEVSPTDPLTLGASGLLLTAVSLLACWLPARRASKVHPMEALRYE